VTGPGDRIELRSLQLGVLVGVLPHERAQQQPVEMDLDVVCDLQAAGSEDDLGLTVDYGMLCERVEQVARAGHVALLETLAERVATAVLEADGRVEEVTVAVRKLRPPVPQQLATSGVRITRTRS
jgi:7,8-dihydroneopterin aldolase/epimerase/oxygenase